MLERNKIKKVLVVKKSCLSQRFCDCSTDMTSSTQKILNLKNPNVGKDSIGKLSFLSGLLLLLGELENTSHKVCTKLNYVGQAIQ